MLKRKNIIGKRKDRGRIRECYHCINFKTVGVTKENIIKFPFTVTLPVMKRLDVYDVVTVYFCKFGLLLKPVYLRNQYTPKMKRKCYMYNKSENNSGRNMILDILKKKR